jgi:thioesterase domain-containing protein/acyl carrier protein
LGGIGLAVAEHLAACGPVHLALLGRTALADGTAAARDPRAAAVDRMRARGASVMTLSADVADPVAMRRAVGAIRARFGRIDGVFHAAGVLRDEIIALRDARPESAVLDSKMKGAWVLDELFRGKALDLFVLFSSVSAVLGLPGQVDYTAANAYLDALATARRVRTPGRSLSINWNAWQEVGMLAGRPPVGDGAPYPEASKHPLLDAVLTGSEDFTLSRGRLSRAACWVVGEHIIKGGDAVVPGTGFLEFVRAAFARGERARPIELAEVVFLAPCVVPATGARNLNVRIERRGTSGFACFDESEDAPFVVGQVRDADPGPDVRVDLATIQARCPRPGPCADGHLVQSFMNFGPRWRNVVSIALGEREAVLSLALPPDLVGDLALFPLHPALLDMATGAAQAIVPDFDPSLTFNVPFSYGRVLIRHPLEARVVSHVRLRDDAARGEAAFDVSIYDEHGRELVNIQRFVMRPAGGAFASANAAIQARAEAAPAASTAALREGMTTIEGIDAFDRMLAADFSPQVIACTVPLVPWLERLVRDAKHGRGNGLGTDGGPVFNRPRVSTNFAAPRDDVEREITQQWRALLGIAEVGIHDDFFELGGQSLVAVRLFQRLSKTYGVDLPLSALFQAPTIAASATLLRARLGLPEPGPDEAAAPSVLVGTSPSQELQFAVPIQRGGGGPPLFVVHGAGGNVLNFRDLAKAMDPAQPVYGLQAAGVNGVSPVHGSIEEMAVAYLAEVRLIARTGPYLLSGYSGGGIVAFEMARMLEECGERVGLLAFIDTFHPQMPVRGSSFFSRLARLQTEGVAYLREVLQRRRQLAADAAAKRAIAFHLAAGEPIPFAMRELHVSGAFEDAARRYHPRTWSGTATLFKAAQVAYYFRAGGPTYSWERDVLGGVHVVTVDGDHNTIVLGANGRRIAEELGRRIALARSGG